MLLILAALYGLKTSGARFHDLFAEVMTGLGFKPCKAEPDIWMRSQGDSWEYVATWVDDLLHVGDNGAQFYKDLENWGFKLKVVGTPKFHLGGDFVRVESPEPVLTWGSHTFVKKMLSKYEKMFGEPVSNREIHAPLEPGDHPELDTSPLCTP